MAHITAAAISAISAKVARQPSACPMSRPSGRPRTVAIALPMAIQPMACCPLPGGARRIASAEVIAQKTACASATPARAASSKEKFQATAVAIWLMTKSAKRASSRPRRSRRATSSIPGSEASATIQAYTVIITPVSAAFIANPAPMSESSAMGMNSVVLKTKAATASVSTRSQARRWAVGCRAVVMANKKGRAVRPC